MANFRYKALTSSGTMLAGEMEAPSRAAVVERLQELGHFPVSAGEAGTEGRDWRRYLSLFRSKRLSQRDLGLVTQQFATLLDAALPVDRALDVLIRLPEAKALTALLRRVLDKVRSGSTLADSLAAAEAFPRVYVSLVRAGETGGTLQRTLAQLAVYLGKSEATREAVKSALIYPALLLVTMGLSLAVILTVVLPEFKGMFDEAGKSLPAMTMVVMAIGDALRVWWWLLALLIIGAAIAVNRALQHEHLRLRWHANVLRLPLFGDLVTKIETARFARTVGTLLSNGVTLPVALLVTRNTLANAAFAQAVGKVGESLKEGERLAALLTQAKVFPALALHFVRVGEEAGNLEDMLLRQADIYDREVQRTIERLLALLSPILTVVLGAIVAGVITSMLIAILSINELAI